MGYKSITAILFILLSFPAICQISYPIVGTGVPLFYGNTGPIACPANPSDIFYRQFPGTPPPYRDNSCGAVSDLVTGLMWVKSRDVKLGQDSAFIQAMQCTLGGYNYWRVPTIKELYSLINLNGKSAPDAPHCFAYIDTNGLLYSINDSFFIFTPCS